VILELASRCPGSDATRWPSPHLLCDHQDNERKKTSSAHHATKRHHTQIVASTAATHCSNENRDITSLPKGKWNFDPSPLTIRFQFG